MHVADSVDIITYNTHITLYTINTYTIATTTKIKSIIKSFGFNMPITETHKRIVSIHTYRNLLLNGHIYMLIRHSVDHNVFNSST